MSSIIFKTILQKGVPYAVKKFGKKKVSNLITNKKSKATFGEKAVLSVLGGTSLATGVNTISKAYKEAETYRNLNSNNNKKDSK